MKKPVLISTLWAMLAFACSCNTASKSKGSVISELNALHHFIQYEGRITHGNDYTRMYWSGTSATIRFRGTGVKAVLQDFNGQNHFNVVLDGRVVSRIRIDSVKKEYELAAGLALESHTLALIKITQINKDYNRGYTDLFNFTVSNGESFLEPPTPASRKIEFYGNSITCGHAILDSAGGDRGASVFEDNYQSYAAITARHFNARYRCIAKSGIGVSVSFGEIIMPEMFDRTNPFDSLSKWNFSNYIPDVVVVNLLQNDQAILGRPEYVQYKKRFGSMVPTKEFVMAAYLKFIKTLRTSYPSSAIICVMGSMDITRDGSPWPTLVREAVASLHDPKIYTHFFPYKGSPKHPLVKDHEAMAQSLISFIDQKIKW